MLERTETQIRARWQSPAPTVSIVCSTYNHEPYIAEAIDSFLRQETTFPFEVIVNDDASTDGTTAIVKEYARAYPNIVRPIFQLQNQYSQGVKPALVTAAGAEGEYVAFCDGDDHWNDPRKLARQIRELERHPGCDFSFHTARAVFEGNERLNRNICHHAYSLKNFPVEEVIVGGGAFCPTASQVIRKRVFTAVPEWVYTEAPVGDYYWQVFGAERGGALYLPEVMAVYRARAQENWNRRMSRDSQSIVEKCKRDLHTLSRLDAHFDHRYAASILRAKSNYLLAAAIQLLVIAEFDLFGAYVERSWALKPGASRRQTYFYRLRRQPRLLSFVQRLKRSICPPA